MSLLVTTFGSEEEFQRGRAILEDRGLAYEVLSPEPGFRLVAASALEIFKRLPKANCKACGEPNRLAFAVRVWSGEVSLTDCHPVFDDAGEKVELREALEEVCAALGV